MIGFYFVINNTILDNIQLHIIRIFFIFLFLQHVFCAQKDPLIKLIKLKKKSTEYNELKHILLLKISSAHLIYFLNHIDYIFW